MAYLSFYIDAVLGILHLPSLFDSFCVSPFIVINNNLSVQ